MQSMNDICNEQILFKQNAKNCLTLYNSLKSYRRREINTKTFQFVIRNILTDLGVAIQQPLT